MDTYKADRRGAWFFPTAFAALLVFHLAANIWWLKHDHHPIRLDEAMHMNAAQDYRAILIADIPGLLIKRPVERGLMLVQYSFVYPPLPHLMSAVVSLPIGAGVDTLAFASTLIFLALITGMYCFARCFLERWEALFVAFVTSFTPSLYGGSRCLSGDFWAAAFVVWTYVALLKADFFRNRRWAIACGVLMGLGMLSRQYTVLFYVVPCALWVVLGLCKALRPADVLQTKRAALRALGANFLLTGAVALLVCAPWYLWNLGSLLDFWIPFLRERTPSILRVISTTPTAPSTVPVIAPVPITTPGPISPTGAGVWGSYLIFTINKGVFLPMFLACVVGLGVALHRRFRHLNLLVAFLWYVCPCVFLTALFSCRTPRYMLPMLAPVPLFAAIALLGLPRAWLRRGAMALFAGLLLFQFGNLTFASYGRFSRAVVPLFSQHPSAREYWDFGLVVYQDELIMGRAYTFAHPFTGEDYYNRILKVMADHDAGQMPVDSRRALFATMNLEKMGLEFKQKAFWPLRDPCSFTESPARSPDPVCPFVSLRSRYVPKRVTTTLLRAGASKVRLPVSPVFLLNGAPGMCGPAPAVVDIPVPSELVVDLAEPCELSALSIDFPLAESSFADYSVQCRDPRTGQLVDFNPPVVFHGSSQGSQTQHHFYTFETVSTSGLVLSAKAATTGFNSVPVGVMDLYQHIPQPRPLHCVGQKWGLASLLSDSDLIETSDYLVLAVLSSERAEELEAQLRVPPLASFCLLDRFPIESYGFSLAGTATVLGRALPPLLNFETCPAFRVSVSGDLYPNGRWDLPWWRFPEYTAYHNRAQQDYWACPVPAVVEVSLGQPCEINAIEIVPYTEQLGVREGDVQYWDPEQQSWRRPEKNRLQIKAPKHREDDTKSAPRAVPSFWEAPIETDRLRVTLTKGGVDSLFGNIAYVSNFFIYGRRLDVDPGQSRPAQ